MITQKFGLNGSVRPADRLNNVKLNDDSDFLMIENRFWSIYKKICSLAVSEVSQRCCRCVTVANDRSLVYRGLFFFFSCSKAKWREVRATGPCMTIILCAPLTYTDLVIEQKGQMPQVAGEKKNCDQVCEIAPGCFPRAKKSERRKSDGHTRTKKQLADTAGP